jgi:hypothetical protein
MPPPPTFHILSEGVRGQRQPESPCRRHLSKAADGRDARRRTRGSDGHWAPVHRRVRVRLLVLRASETNRHGDVTPGLSSPGCLAGACARAVAVDPGLGDSLEPISPDSDVADLVATASTEPPCTRCAGACTGANAASSPLRPRLQLPRNREAPITGVRGGRSASDSIGVRAPALRPNATTRRLACRRNRRPTARRLSSSHA